MVVACQTLGLQAEFVSLLLSVPGIAASRFGGGGFWCQINGGSGEIAGMSARGKRVKGVRHCEAKMVDIL